LGTDGRPLPGYSLKECDELLDRTVTWSGRSEVKAPAGQIARIYMVLSDADLYSLQFQPLAMTRVDSRCGPRKRKAAKGH
jgi:hypothetical protein